MSYLIEPSFDNTAIGFGLLGSSLKGESLGYGYSTATGVAGLVDNQVRFVAVYLKKSATLTGIKLLVQAAGSYTADQNNRIGLYSYSAGTLTLVASSTDDANVWTASTNSLLTIPFSTTYPAESGVYFVGLLWNASITITPPSFFGASISALKNAYDFTNSAKLSTTLAGQNDLPSSLAISGNTNSTTGVWIGLY